MPDELSVRQWQEKFRAGAFEKDNKQMRELAGWGEVDDPLNNWRMKKLSRLIYMPWHGSMPVWGLYSFLDMIHLLHQ